MTRQCAKCGSEHLEGVSTSQGPRYRCRGCGEVWEETQTEEPLEILLKDAPRPRVDSVQVGKLAARVYELLQPLTVEERQRVLNAATALLS